MSCGLKNSGGVALLVASGLTNSAEELGGSGHRGVPWRPMDLQLCGERLGRVKRRDPLMVRELTHLQTERRGIVRSVRDAPAPLVACGLS